MVTKKVIVNEYGVKSLVEAGKKKSKSTKPTSVNLNEDKNVTGEYEEFLKNKKLPMPSELVWSDHKSVVKITKLAKRKLNRAEDSIRDITKKSTKKTSLSRLDKTVRLKTQC